MTIDTLNTIIAINPEAPSQAVSAYLAGIGRRGGAAGTGKGKTRSATHYKAISKLAVAARWKGHVKKA